MTPLERGIVETVDPLGVFLPPAAEPAAQQSRSRSGSQTQNGQPAPHSGPIVRKGRKFFG